MVFDSGTAFAESDADDEYERSNRSTPILTADCEAAFTDSEGFSSSNGHTPTTYAQRYECLR